MNKVEAYLEKLRSRLPMQTYTVLIRKKKSFTQIEVDARSLNEASEMVYDAYDLESVSHTIYIFPESAAMTHRHMVVNEPTTKEA